MESSIAARLIQECIETKNETLDLSNCGLDQNSPELNMLKDCVHVKVLNFSRKKINKDGGYSFDPTIKNHNQFLSIPKQIGDLTNLTTLDIGDNKIEKIENLSNLHQLNDLNLSFNKINKIEKLQELKNLSKLTLSVNQITSIENLESNTNLKEVWLNSNKISVINFPVKSVSLERLSLSYNQISKIENLDGLINLTSLYIGKNKITKIENLNGLKKLRVLTLEQNQIKKIENINSLTELSYLNLEGNRIEGIKNLTNPSLTSIFLSGNPLDHVPEPYKSRIQATKEFENCLKTVKEYLDSIPKWKKQIDYEIEYKTGKLDLSRCDLKEIPAEVNTMVWLKDIDCSYNAIQKITNINNLTGLETIDLQANLLTKIENLGKNTKLKSLGLSDNLIESIENIDHLVALEQLYIARNKIEDISSLVNLPKIKRVIITHNNITTLKPILSFATEKKIPISAEFSYSETDTGFFVAENPLSFPPISIIQQGSIGIQNYLKTMNKATSVRTRYKNKFFKIILLGNSEAGKSAFIKRFVNPKKTNDTSTHYLEIEEWSGKDIKKEISSTLTIDNDAIAFVYDFGGQEYYHDTHKIYFTDKTLYLLFWEKRTNNYVELKSSRRDSEELIQHYPLSYWLESISYLLQPKITQSDSQNDFNADLERNSINKTQKSITPPTQNITVTAPILVIENKIDLSLNQRPTLLNQLEFNDYPINIFAFEGVGIEKDVRMDQFKSSLTEILQYLNPNAEELPNYYEEVVNGIFKDAKRISDTYLRTKKDFIERFKTEYMTKDFDLLNNETEQEQVLHYLASKGIIIYKSNYFSNNNVVPEIEQLVIVNPELFRKKMYEFFNQVKRLNGTFTQSHLNENNITSDVLLYLKHFKLIFQLDENKFIAPIYLPKHPEEIVNILLDKLPNPKRRFLFTGYIHKTIIIETFSCLKERQNLFHYYWKDGIIISNSNQDSKIFIKFITQKYEDAGNMKGKCYIELYALNEDTNIDFLKEIIDILKKITVGLNIIEQVTANGIDFVCLETLNKKSESNIMQFEDNGIVFKIADFNKFLTNRHGMKKIFISYAEEDNLFRETVEGYLSTLKRQGLISTWFDRRILPGGNWSKEIQTNMKEADIILCLITPDYFKESKSYIWDVEIPIICDKLKQNENCVIPILIKDTPSWYNVPIGNDTNQKAITFGEKNWLPTKSHIKHSQYKDESEAWANVAKGIEDVIKVLMTNL